MQKMDESYLSDVNVIHASRDFVCIRLATYEDESEAEFLKTVFVGRSGELENSVFVLLSPDTKHNLCRPGRSPNFAFATPTQLAEEMVQIAKGYESSATERLAAPGLPQLKDVRLGLNVGACDGLPSLVCLGSDPKQLIEMQEKIVGLAFSEELAGKFVYASSTDANELSPISGLELKPGFASGYALVKPGAYGLEGELIKWFRADVEIDELKNAMVRYTNTHEKSGKDHRQHVRTGVLNEKNWTTEIPVTDEGSLRAMKRNARWKR